MTALAESDRMLTQRREAIKLANEVRLAKARIKRNIGQMPHEEGRDLVADLLEHPSGHVPGIAIGSLLRSIEKVGLQRVCTWLKACDVRSSDLKVRDLTERQRLAMACILRASCRRRKAAR